mmetsp:Transcript_37959/g.105619  ORF Transcript_37959/g.105619 Transcript_37959/m.105619 type:complete len:274 (-) Transcript_37959:1344-2165(-)
MLGQEEGQQQEDATVAHDPPDIDVAVQPVRELRPGLSLREQHHLIEHHGHLHHTNEAGARLLGLLPSPAPLRRPSCEDAIGLEGAEARDLHETEETARVILSVHHPAETLDAVRLQEVLHGLLAVKDPSLLHMGDEHAALAEDIDTLGAADAAQNGDAAPALQLRREAQELRFVHVQDLVLADPIDGVLLTDGGLRDHEKLRAPVFGVRFVIQLLQDVPRDLELEALEAVAPLDLVRVERRIGKDHRAEDNRGHGDDRRDGKHHPNAEDRPYE